LTQPKGLFTAFVEKLPKLHEACVMSKLKDVRLWDLPGAGTNSHPSDKYFEDKGIIFYDFLVVMLGDTPNGDDLEFLEKLCKTKVQYILVRSKLDLTLHSTMLDEKTKQQRRLSDEEKLECSKKAMDTIRLNCLTEMKKAVPHLADHLYLVCAEKRVDDEGAAHKVSLELSETQLAFDRILLTIILDRHGHDLSTYFNDSYQCGAKKQIFNLLMPIFKLFKKEKVTSALGGQADFSFETSSYKTLYHDERTHSPADKAEVLKVTRNLLEKYAEETAGDITKGIRLYDAIVRRLDETAAPQAQPGLTEVQYIAGRLWSCDETADLGKELCSILNHVLRQDEGLAFEHAVQFSHALGSLCVLPRNGANPLTMPAQATTYRGTYIPHKEMAIFGKLHTYRCAMFLATSFSKDQANKFLADGAASNTDKHAVIFEFTRDETCKHAIYIEDITSCRGETELLIQAYSAFEVTQVSGARPDKLGTRSVPMVVKVRVIADGKTVAEDLPVAKWA